MAKSKLCNLLVGLVAVVVSSGFVPGDMALAQDAPAGVVREIVNPPFPELRLGIREAGGQRALDLLGARLPEVAAWYGHTPQEFRSMFLKDKTLRIDNTGRMFVVDELEAPLLAPAATPESGIIDGALAPLDKTFFLHSRPDAKRTIVLNFKGTTLTGTAWNSSNPTIVAPPYSFEGDTATFSNNELTRIQYIWQRVAEDYAPFDVNVTTEMVSQDRISRSSSSDDTYGTVALITTQAGVYNCSCGGVAYVGVFNSTSDYNKPALVFYDRLGSGNEKYVAEAISHEVGHNAGLSHDGTSTKSYYSGHGSGVTGWAPIMGVGYYQALSQWSKGEYFDANQKQDDYVIAQGRGLPLRTDDFGGTAAASTLLSGATANGVTQSAAQGVIERPGDVDVFAITAGPGQAALSLNPSKRAPNADLSLRLLDSNGVQLAADNPADLLTASITYMLPATGTYYLEVKGVGKGDPLQTGYTDYGSLGLYRLTASYPDSGVPAPVASFTLSPESGTAPLYVTMTAQASADSTTTYEWDYGDGTSSSPLTYSTTNRTYTSPGTYNVTLKVTNGAGLSSTAAKTLTVNAPTVVNYVKVQSITMSSAATKRGLVATATVRIVNSNGVAIQGASVSGYWSGLVSSSTSTASTNSSGDAVFKSPATKATGGSITFNITNVTLSGYSYDTSGATSGSVLAGASAVLFSAQN